MGRGVCRSHRGVPEKTKRVRRLQSGIGVAARDINKYPIKSPPESGTHGRQESRLRRVRHNIAWIDDCKAPKGPPGRAAGPIEIAFDADDGTAELPIVACLRPS